MTVEDRAPAFRRDKYVCPFCGTYSVQRWSALYIITGPDEVDAMTWRVDCDACSDFQLWLDESQRMVEPDRPGVPPPNEDLLDEIKEDYREAASILGRSPRGAAALLRLCLQKLCVQLGESGDNINADIASLVAKGLPVPIQQALDALRVNGNNAVHPGEIDLRDDHATAAALFDLLNLIATDRISEPKRVQAMYDRLPLAARQAIEARVSPKSAKQPKG